MANKWIVGVVFGMLMVVSCAPVSTIDDVAQLKETVGQLRQDVDQLQQRANDSGAENARLQRSVEIIGAQVQRDQQAMDKLSARFVDLCSQVQQFGVTTLAPSDPNG